MSAVPQPHVPPETRGKHKTIAIIAAEWHLRSLVRAALENKRTRVFEYNSLEGLEAATQGDHIDLVILDDDCALHETSGRSQRAAMLANVPVILLTDDSPTEEDFSTSIVEPDRTLHKHFSPFELLNHVYALIGY